MPPTALEDHTLANVQTADALTKAGEKRHNPLVALFLTLRAKVQNLIATRLSARRTNEVVIVIPDRAPQDARKAKAKPSAAAKSFDSNPVFKPKGQPYVKASQRRSIVTLKFATADEFLAEDITGMLG